MAFCLILRKYVLELLHYSSLIIYVGTFLNMFGAGFQESKLHAGGPAYHSESDGSPMFQRDLKSLLERYAQLNQDFKMTERVYIFYNHEFLIVNINT